MDLGFRLGILTNGSTDIRRQMDEQQIIKSYLSRLGRKGGSVKGPQKVRPKEHYQKAVGIRWAKYREHKQTEGQPPKTEA